MTRHAQWALALGLTLLSAAVALHFARPYTSGAYVYTLIGGAVFIGVVFYTAWQSRRVSKLIYHQSIWLAIFSVAWAMEEMGWFAWRLGIRPSLFEFSAAAFLKSIIGAALFAWAAVTIQFLRRGETGLGEVGRLAFCGALSVGLILSLLARDLIL